jgi:uncharacterized protein with GYD domain
MPLYVNLYRFTDQGRKTIKDSPKRLREVTARIEKMGVKVHHALYTSGQYDLVVVSEAANDELALAVMGSLAQAGNVVSETLHAYTADQMEKILSKVP